MNLLGEINRHIVVEYYNWFNLSFQNYERGNLPECWSL